ncbi:hypothetical protein WJX74_006905 [Apatococcus lobatus]|uniref:Uncharacterized protein n=1 Tax=Apatococcus lobatus TaxID=904363 RepID=A0AAW1RVV7_9CHLO
MDQDHGEDDFSSNVPKVAVTLPDSCAPASVSISVFSRCQHTMPQPAALGRYLHFWETGPVISNICWSKVLLTILADRIGTPRYRRTLNIPAALDRVTYQSSMLGRDWNGQLV